MYVCSSYLLNAKIGFGLDWTVAYAAAGVLTAVYGILVVRAGAMRRRKLDAGEIDPHAFETMAGDEAALETEERPA